MKWYFALSGDSLRSQRYIWEPLIIAALASCRQHTDLEPYFVFDGIDDPLLTVLESEGVTVVRHRVSFYDALAAHRPEEPGWLLRASGAFLRTEIPAIEDDEFILYTDCDVVFTGPVELDDYAPRFFACAPEHDWDDANDFNTGVMVMNTHGLRAELAEFREFVIDNLDKFGSFDQDAYRLFYKDRADALPLDYNWRPYWGVADDARIVHFHVVKPHEVMRLIFEPDLEMRLPLLRTLHDHDPHAYRHYLSQWLTAAGDSAALI